MSDVAYVRSGYRKISFLAGRRTCMDVIYRDMYLQESDKHASDSAIRWNQSLVQVVGNETHVAL